jgi:hypothetical protein
MVASLTGASLLAGPDGFFVLPLADPYPCWGLVEGFSETRIYDSMAGSIVPAGPGRACAPSLGMCRKRSALSKAGAPRRSAVLD